MVDRAAWSRSVKATSSSPRLGKPRARQSFRADSSDTPAPAATSRRRSLRSPPSSRASRALAASLSADITPVGGAGSSAGAAACSAASSAACRGCLVLFCPVCRGVSRTGHGLRRTGFEGGVRGGAGTVTGLPGHIRCGEVGVLVDVLSVHLFHLLSSPRARPRPGCSSCPQPPRTPPGGRAPMASSMKLRNVTTSGTSGTTSSEGIPGLQGYIPGAQYALQQRLLDGHIADRRERNLFIAPPQHAVAGN